MTNEQKSSRLPGFYKMSHEERIDRVVEWAQLNEYELAVLGGNGLSIETANEMIENVVTIHGLPMGVAANFLINEREFLVPMAVEEPSVVAAASNMAKLMRTGGGIFAECDPPVMIGQIQVLDVPDMDAAVAALEKHKEKLMESADSVTQGIVVHGGGSRDMEFRPLPDTPVGPMLIVHLLYDCRDAMGANSINTALEYIAPQIADLTGGRTNLRILSNLADRRTVTVRTTIPAKHLAIEGMDGTEVAQRIAEANAFAVADPYRASTHNKGIMNGIDAVVVATGNDWRAIEAGAHAYAARSGQYRALTDWHVTENGDLFGELTLPMAVGTVGGATRVHPTAQVALRIMGIKTASELAEIIAAVGLAQNLGALKALATVGINQGHMKLHARQMAMAAGATSDNVQAIVDQLINERNITVERAQEILAQ